MMCFQATFVGDSLISGAVLPDSFLTGDLNFSCGTALADFISLGTSVPVLRFMALIVNGIAYVRYYCHDVPHTVLCNDSSKCLSESLVTLVRK
jgi:hypothetical protein